MSATDEMCHLLNEHEIEYMLDQRHREVFWDFGESGRAKASAIGTKGLVQMIVTGLTPEQAIDATLGSRTCKLVETEHEGEISDDGYYMYLSYDCDECGHENTEYGRFCAGCGRKVVDE